MKKLPTELISKTFSSLFQKAERSNYHPAVFEENLGEEHPYPDFNKAHLSWIAPEYLQHPKSLNWWVGAAIIAVIAFILEALSGNWTMLLATFVFAVVYWFTHQFHPPRHTKINISELGVKIGHREVPYEEIETFWIIYSPPHVKRLFLRTKSRWLNDLVIELEGQDPQHVRSFLERHVSEIVGKKEHFSDIVLRIFKL